jgi:hypothetical protein
MFLFQIVFPLLRRTLAPPPNTSRAPAAFIAAVTFF